MIQLARKSLFKAAWLGAISCGLVGVVEACIWDGETIKVERGRAPKMAEVLSGTNIGTIDVRKLQERIKELKSTPRESDPDWWNDLAGTHIRLGEIGAAIAILEPLTNRFGTNYGIHANLGTAYHLQGRYSDAEREIAKDLEINPDAHFGLERYHLALLQYLVRDPEYQKRHLYIDEWSSTFRDSEGKRVYGKANEGIITTTAMPLSESGWKRDSDGTELDDPPLYRYRWNLAADPKFEEGILYMASLNPREPACWTMLGVACLEQRNYNLATKAYEKAISLKSPQADLLRAAIPDINTFVAKSIEQRHGISVSLFLGVGLLFGLIYLAFLFLRKFFS